MLKLFTGNINEALQTIKPDVYLNDLRELKVIT